MNNVRQYRQQQGWTQSTLASRSGISRAGVSAIEINRLVPSVQAALSLANSLNCSVEDLFGRTTTVSSQPQWAWLPPHLSARYWEAEVNGKKLYYPVESRSIRGITHDGIFKNDGFISCTQNLSKKTLVMASCDPCAELLASEYYQTTSNRLLCFTRSSQEALSLLQQGLIHVAGLHYSTKDHPNRNRQIARQWLKDDYCLLRMARWREGIAIQHQKSLKTAKSILRSKVRWVGREPGSAARQCLDDLLPHGRSPQRIAYDHRGVAEAVANGWADVGICHQLVSEEAGLHFIPLRTEDYDLCFPKTMEQDDRLQALLRVARLPSYRKMLAELPGYDACSTGELQSLR